MPNIGALIKQEIVRLSRKEIRTLVDPLRKAAAEHRRQGAALRQQVAALERQVVRLAKAAQGKPAPVTAEPLKLRFVAKGLRSHRAKLGLSAADYGKLVGVTAQSIYNWEQGHATPRTEQVAVIASLRKVGKREALQRIEAVVAGSDAPPVAPKRTRRKRAAVSEAEPAPASA